MQCNNFFDHVLISNISAKNSVSGMQTSKLRWLFLIYFLPLMKSVISEADGAILKIESSLKPNN